LIVKDDDLAVATHGRAFWVLDDITPLRQLSAHSEKDEMILYKPRTTFRYRWPEDYERRQPVAPNPPSGAIISYYFKSAPKGEVNLDILDAQGKVVRSFSSVDKKEAETPPEWPDQEPPQEKISADAGLNRFTWNLRYDGPKKLPGEVGAEYRNKGPYGMPGNYQVRLTAEGKTQTVPLELKVDPRVNVSMADLQKQFDLDMKIRAQLSDLHQTVEEIRSIRQQFHTLNARLAEDARYKPITTASDSLDKRMTPIEEQLLQVKIKSSEASLNYPVLVDEQLHNLAVSVDDADAPPTQQQEAAFESLRQQASPLIAQWKQIESTDVVALNDMMQKQSVPAIYLAPAGAQGQAKAGGQK
jgi:hypothetical protein